MLARLSKRPLDLRREWPLRVIATIIFVTVVYWIVGFQHDAGKFFRYLLIGIWEFTAMNGIGLLVRRKPLETCPGSDDAVTVNPERKPSSLVSKERRWTRALWVCFKAWNAPEP